MMYGIDVRIILIVAGFILACVAGDPLAVFDAFQKTVGKGEIIGPICTAMGYAFVVRATKCDVAMVNLLMRPLRKAAWLLIPGGCFVGFVTNMAITSQTAAAAALGPVLVPIMLGAGHTRIAAAATLLIGCSVGGNLFNPGEPDIVAIQTSTNAGIGNIINAAFIPNIISLVVAMIALYFVAHKTQSVHAEEQPQQTDDLPKDVRSWLRALLPPLPVVMLLVLQPSLNFIPWLTSRYPQGIYVSMVMIICTTLVLIVHGKEISRIASEFFEGMGYAMAKVISIILAASCFIGGLAALGAIEYLATVFGDNAALAAVASPILTWGLAVLGGSGTAPSVAFSQSMLPALSKVDAAGAVDLGIAGAIGASVGRTMSPVAAVVLFTSTLADVPLPQLVKFVAIPMVLSLLSIVLYGLFS